ncbi:Uncharacterised protein [uncultured Flavonifractor sp.]|nr:Uncharacterised protein [uncultured Flavonifractor sp.]
MYQLSTENMPLFVISTNELLGKPKSVQRGKGRRHLSVAFYFK